MNPNPIMILPFGLLLALIALAPLLMANWWSRQYARVALGLGAVTVLYYLFGLHAPARVLAVGEEYLSFIALIGSLYVVAGGIHIRVKGEATPAANVLFLLVGALVSNVLGTTGASMLLIRPWIRMNRYRITAHHVVFFIFLVSNVGGCLTPIGDPPLFLGYLHGIPFWWVARYCWPLWAVAVAALLLVFYVIDRRNFQRAPREVRTAETAHETWALEGSRNLVFLGIILGAVFVNHPHFVREALMLAAAAGSYYTTPRPVHEANHFNFHPIREVAILFIGIFATMMPALDWLAVNAAGLLGGRATPGLFYWGTGTLSGVLDNAPTYLSFLSAAIGSLVDPALVAHVQTLVTAGGAAPEAASAIGATWQMLLSIHGGHLPAVVSREEVEIACLLGQATLARFVLAISAGAVFFGAMTYIGNGPNFMVKAIADQRKVHTPTFLGYVFRFAVPYLLPVLALVWFLFLRQ